MKKAMRILYLGSSLILFLFSLNTALADTISIRSDTWCPYVCDDTEKPGYMVEAVKQIFAKHGHRVDFKIQNWVEAIKGTRSNKSNGLIGCSHSDAPDFIFPTKSLGAMTNFYYVKKSSNWVYLGRESLKGKKIGVIEGYTYGDAIDNLVKTKHDSIVVFSEPTPLDKILKAMETGKLDAFVESPTVLRFYLGPKKIPLETYKAVSPNLANDPDLFVSFSPNNPKSSLYADIVSRGILELRQSGELQKILDRYNLLDWIDSQVLSSIAAVEKLSPVTPEVGTKKHIANRGN